MQWAGLILQAQTGDTSLSAPAITIEKKREKMFDIDNFHISIGSPALLHRASPDGNTLWMQHVDCEGQPVGQPFLVSRALYEHSRQTLAEITPLLAV